MSFETEEANVILEPIIEESDLVEPVTEQVVEEPVVEPVAEPVAEPVPDEPVVESVVEPVPDEPVVEQVPDEPADAFEDNVIKKMRKLSIHKPTNMLSSIIGNTKTKKGHLMKHYKRPVPLLYKN